MSISVGRKLILWRVKEVRKSIWVDGMGNPRWVVVIGEQVPVVVTKVEIIPSGIPVGRQMEKLEAVSESGVVYTRCSQKEHRDSDIGHVCSWRDGENEFHEACCSYNNRFTPYVTAEGDRAVPLGATICKIHNYAYMPDNPARCLYG